MGAVVAAIVGGVAAIAGGAIVAGGAKSAANAQAQAAREAQAAQDKQYQNQVALQEPFRQAGLTAQGRIMNLMGLNAPGGGGGGYGGASTNPADYGLTQVNIPSGGGFGGMGGFEGQPTYIDAQGNVVSDVDAYMAANPLPTAQGGAQPADFGKYAKDFSMSDFTEDPGYAFRQSEGLKALDRSASARGGLLSGGALKGIQRFGQDLASQEYGNAFNRYQTNRSNQLNPLQSLMGAGQTATNTLTTASMQQGQNSATNAYNAGQARASGYVGQANALSGALSGVGNAAQGYAQNKMLSSYLGGIGGGGGYIPTSTMLGSGTGYLGGAQTLGGLSSSFGP
jgi:hypothetical protein